MNTRAMGFPTNPALDDEHRGWIWDGNKWEQIGGTYSQWENVSGGISYNDGDVNTTGKFVGDGSGLTNIPTSDGSSYDDTQIKADLATETQDRTTADSGLQDQIDNLDLSGTPYDDTEIKADLVAETQARTTGDSGLQDQIDNLDLSGTPYDDTEIKEDISGLQDQIDNLPTDGGGAVDSVNGQTGVVVLDASDVGALPDTYTAPSAPVDSVNGQTGAVSLSASDVGALPDSYSAPVDSVNGQTGAVSLNASDVGALPDNYTPPAAPVTSVNGKTNAVVLSAADVGASASNHNHSGVYANASHSHDYAASNHNHSGVYATSSHTHSGYAASNHSHSGYLSSTGLTNNNGTLSGTDFVASSDMRLKNHISTASSDIINKLNGREWMWKSSGNKGSGVIAQELEDAGLEHLVKPDMMGEKAVAYNGLTAYLIEAVKELSARVKELEVKDDS